MEQLAGLALSPAPSANGPGSPALEPGHCQGGSPGTSGSSTITSAGSGCASSTASGAGPGSLACAWLGEEEEEVVEIKNTCPFGMDERRRLYQLHDRGPRQHVAAEWVPQLQLHMLCAGTQSGLLISRSGGGWRVAW